MQIEIIDNVDYEKAAKILYESYIPQWGIAGSPEWSAEYIEYLDKTYIKPRAGPYIGAYEGEDLVAFAINLAVAHHEEKAYDKAGFNNDRSKRPLYVKAIGNEFKEWLLKSWKYKTYYISYLR